MTGAIDFGDLRRLTPIDGAFGGGRGKPIDRHYIEAFIARNAADVQGRVLEVAESHYTRRYGGGRVTASDVLHVDSAAHGATVVADLAGASADQLPGAAFDCFICTQTLQYVFDLQRAVGTIHRILKPGGVLLLTAPGISQISPYDREQWGEHWRFTAQSLQRLLAADFTGRGASVDAAAHGNVLAAVGFLHGLACEDLTAAELDHADDRYPLLVTARAQKLRSA